MVFPPKYTWLISRRWWDTIPCGPLMEIDLGTCLKDLLQRYVIHTCSLSVCENMVSTVHMNTVIGLGTDEASVLTVVVPKQPYRRELKSNGTIRHVQTCVVWLNRTLVSFPPWCDWEELNEAIVLRHRPNLSWTTPVARCALSTGMWMAKSWLLVTPGN